MLMSESVRGYYYALGYEWSRGIGLGIRVMESEE